MIFFRLLFFTLLTCIFSFASAQVVDVSIVNSHTVGDTLKFEIHMKASTSGTYHIGGNIYVKYNTNAFGTSIVGANRLIVTKRQLLDNVAYLKNPEQDFNTDVFTINWINFQSFAFDPPSAFHTEIPDTGFVPFCDVAMIFDNNAVAPNISLENITTVSFENASGVSNVYTVNLVNASLPVEWISFTADRLDNRNIQLRWETASEINNDYYLVQRSVDGVIFEEIGNVKGAGTTDRPTTYEFLDNTYQANINYYRLKQVDYNGVFEFSNIVEVRFNGTGDDIAFHVFPSPAREFVNLEVLGVIEDNSFEFKIFDQTGKTIYIGELNRENTKQRVEVENLPEGIYNYEIIGNYEIVKTGRFVKLK